VLRRRSSERRLITLTGPEPPPFTGVSNTKVIETARARPFGPTTAPGNRRIRAAVARDYAVCGKGRYAARCSDQVRGFCGGVMCGSEAFPGTDIGAIGGSGCALGRSRAGRSSLLNSVFAAQL
jgi:hypothetical protein